MQAHAVDWTSVLITIVTTLGTLLSGIFAARAKQHSTVARDASVVATQSADRAVEASLRPPGGGES